MQPITRVHNIYRIRTIVNAVTEMNKRRRFPHDTQIAKVLADRGLSKFRTDKASKIKDRIMRRARDHLLTASYMGFLTRIGRPLVYSSTTAGKYLDAYPWGEECPKDELEEAVFIDKLMRLKLTNVYDMQSGGQYENLRSRPVLFLLYALTGRDWLHEHQLAVIAGGRRCDPVLADTSSMKLLEKIATYGGSVDKLNRFYGDFRVRDSDRKNMTRNIRPLLDWCQSLGFVISKDLDDSPGRWWRLAERGEKILEFYASKYPLWFQDLEPHASVKAAVLIFCQYAKEFGIVFDDQFLKLEFQSGLTTVTAGEIIAELPKQVKFQDSIELESEMDFTLEYDVPPERRDEVREHLKVLSHVVHMKLEPVTTFIETSSIQKLKKMLESEREVLRSTETDRFRERTAIRADDPLMGQVKGLIPSIGVLGQYRSDFEREAAILLRLVRVNAIKYQGQFADRCRRSHVMRFFENNPDILILNGIEILVECKSTGEWHPPLIGVKSVPKEIIIYQQYMPEVNPNSTVIIYEGSLDSQSRNYILGIIEDAKDIVFVNKNFLINCAYKPAHRDRFIAVIREPKRFTAEQRLLVE